LAAIESILQDYLILKHAGKPEIIDINMTVPAGMTITWEYTVPKGYTWLKIDTRYGPMENRVFKITIYADESVEAANWDISDAMSKESWRCIGVGSIVHKKMTTIATNTDSVARNADMVLRGVLIPDNNVESFMKDLRTTYTHLTDDTIEKLADKIVEKMKK